MTRVSVGPVVGQDRYGKPVYGPDVETVVGEALFDPGGTRESLEPGRDVVTTEPTLYFRAAFPEIESGDRVDVRGSRFLVEGDRTDWTRPGARARGAVVKLRRVEG